jgi:hypothetical protein
MVVYARVWSPGQVIVLLAGALFLVFGAIAVIDGGLSGPLTDPVVQVFGFNHTPLLGLFELAAGALLVLSALTGSRSTSAVLGMLLVVGGILVLAEQDWVMTHLTDQREFGWVPVLAGAACVLALMLLPELRRHRRTALR